MPKLLDRTHFSFVEIKLATACLTVALLYGQLVHVYAYFLNDEEENNLD